MKAIYSIFILLIVIPVEAGMRSEIQLNGDKIVSFRYNVDSGSESRLLSLEKGRESETIWASQEAEPVFLDVGREDRYYESMELVAAELRDEVIVTVFKLSPGKYKFVPEHMLAKDYLLNRQGVVSDFDTVVRVFVKRNGWQPELTFYPQTFYGDTINETVEDIAILGEGLFELKYKNTWVPVGGVSSFRDAPYKVYRGDGGITKQVKWRKEKGVLVGTNDKTDLIYVENSVWWHGEPLFEVGGGNLRKNQYFRLLKNNLKLAKESDHPIERCRFLIQAP